MDNDRIQEIFLVIGDKLAPVKKAWWYALALTLILLIPFYYLLKFSLAKAYSSHYEPPKIVYSAAVQTPLQIIDKQVFSLGDNAYSGYIKIQNINLQWGVADQPYTVTFQTYGGTTINTINGSTYVLPSSEQLVVFSRFTSQTHPDVMNVTLGDTHFILKPDVPDDLGLQRVSLQNNSTGLVVSAGVENMTALTIGQIDLPVAIYNNQNQIIAVNFTYISDVLSGETRTFQYSWPVSVPGAVRAEIDPEIDIFNRSLFSNQQNSLPLLDQGGP